jgi:murein L,D-transpeptidase YcbB/YkuD
VNETRPRRPSGRAAGSEPLDDPRDDWLGDVSDDDWSESPSPSLQSAPSGFQHLPAREDEPLPRPSARAAGADRTDVKRRRIVAGILILALAAVVGVIAALALRGGGSSPPTTATEPVASPTTAPTTTSPTTTPAATTPTETTPTETTPTTTTPTTPETGGATGFTLPEGTKLQRDAENDPAVVRELQQALTAAGYNPGTADGTYGEQTEAAVVAFQTANGLAVDGRVGPETAAALNSALASG